MKKLKTLGLLLVLMIGTTTFAQKALVVELRDGSSTTLSLSETPRITFSGERMSIFSSAASMDFLRSDIKNYHFVDTPSSIDETIAPSQAVIESNTLKVSGVAPNTAITLYAVNGVVVKHAVATAGHCTITLNDLTAGLYIVTYNNTTFKFLKK